jgi:hypothetical protein
VSGDRDEDIERRFQEITARIAAEGNRLFGPRGSAKLDRGARWRRVGVRGWLIAAALAGLIVGGTYLRVHGQEYRPNADVRPASHGATPSRPAP